MFSAAQFVMDLRTRGREVGLSPNTYGGRTHSSDNPDSHRTPNDLTGNIAVAGPLGGPHRLVK
jgi:hypothetical protein